MRTSAAMEHLWLYLQSLPKSNKKWLLRKFWRICRLRTKRRQVETNGTRALTADGKQRIKSDENTGQTWHLTRTRT